MPFDPPALHALPREIGIFPLPGALLLPGGRLPLNVFEPRYLALVEDALSNGRHFGMIQPDAAAGATAKGPALYRVGCLGRLSSFAETEDGRFLITLTGVARFTVAQELDLTRGHRNVAADYAEFAADLADPEDSGVNRDNLLAALRAYFRAKEIDANWEAVERMDTAALVTNLSMVCPFEALEKQALLEAPDTEARAEMLEALLRIDSLAAPGHDARPS
ncbi:LON peptidase substrate-binding domain-containing protein [Roseomonas sp. CCTCC AB2023176]|uniref:LON peptidase substrate-binding domain-containing protein n=1 Tax=Roseomonas sp. CCTCC AB2023176 TaxID=3342640 RepID=UPI0035D76EF2